MPYQQSLFKEESRLNDIINYDGEAFYISSFLENWDSNFLQYLKRNITWSQDNIQMYGKNYLIPRLHSWMGESDYSYSGISLRASKWDDQIYRIKNKIESSLDESFNGVLINYYRSGPDYMSWHRDDEKELGYCPTIAILSFGEGRLFSLRHTKDRKQKELLLEDNSLLVMKGETQSHWEHQIKKMSRVSGERISLTFRKIITS